MDIEFLLWDYDTEVRLKAEKDFINKFGHSPTKKEILSNIESNLSALSIEELAKAKTIGNIVMALVANKARAPPPVRGGFKLRYGRFVDEINNKYELPTSWRTTGVSHDKWHNNYTDNEIILCLKILKKVGDLDSLGLIMYSFGHIYHMYPALSLPNLKHIRDELIQCTDEAIMTIGKNTNKEDFHIRMIEILTGPIGYWDGFPEEIDYQISDCLSYTKKHLQWLHKRRMKRDLKYDIEEGLRGIERIEEGYNL